MPQLQRKQIAFKADAVNSDGTFTGYGSVFGNVDSYREIVAPGAFAKSLSRIKASGDPLPVLWQHKADEPLGGYRVLEEDSHGLKLEGFLLKDHVQRAAEAYALMQARVVKGLSIGYYVERDSVDEKTRIRTLTQLDLREISIVTFPANEAAQIDAVKAMLARGDLPTVRDFERFLRESGFTKHQAACLASGGFKALTEQREAESPASHDIAGALRALRRR